MTNLTVRTSGMFHTSTEAILSDLSAANGLPLDQLICYATATALQSFTAFDVAHALENPNSWMDEPRILGMKLQGNFRLPRALRDAMTDKVRELRTDVGTLAGVGVLPSGIVSKCTRSFLINARLQQMAHEPLSAVDVVNTWNSWCASLEVKDVTIFDFLPEPSLFELTYVGEPA